MTEPEDRLRAMALRKAQLLPTASIAGAPWIVRPWRPHIIVWVLFPLPMLVIWLFRAAAGAIYRYARRTTP